MGHGSCPALNLAVALVTVTLTCHCGAPHKVTNHDLVERISNAKGTEYRQLLNEYRSAKYTTLKTDNQKLDDIYEQLARIVSSVHGVVSAELIAERDRLEQVTGRFESLSGFNSEDAN
jgi:hypothetical protein